jgi:DNA-binding transcriptional regulator YiaG
MKVDPDNRLVADTLEAEWNEKLRNLAEIATILNKRGYKSGQGHPFDRTAVKGIKHNYKLKTRFSRLRATGKLTADEVAKLLRVTVATVRRWGTKGTIKTYPYNDRNGCLYEHPGVNSTLMKGCV